MTGGRGCKGIESACGLMTVRGGVLGKMVVEFGKETLVGNEVTGEFVAGGHKEKDGEEIGSDLAPQVQAQVQFTDFNRPATFVPSNVGDTD